MILGKLKKRSYFVLSMFLVLVAQSCSSDYDRFVDEVDSPQNAMTRSNGMEYDVVLQSREFKEYDAQYGNFVSLVREVITRMSKEEKDEFLKLATLCRSEPDKYQPLFEYKVALILGGDSTRISNAYSLLLEKKKVLLENKTLEEKIVGNEGIISMDIRDKWMETNGKHLVTTRTTLKSRSESDKIQRCKERCWKQYEITLNQIDAEYLCASTANIASCAISGGTTIIGNLIVQVGLGAAYIISCEAARDTYDLCIDACDDN